MVFPTCLQANEPIENVGHVLGNCRGRPTDRCQKRQRFNAQVEGHIGLSWRPVARMFGDAHFGRWITSVIVGCSRSSNWLNVFFGLRIPSNRASKS